MKSFFKGIFEKESSISSKRICGFLMVIWSLIAATNRKLIDSITNRYFFVPNPVVLFVKNISEEKVCEPLLHPEHPKKGTRKLTAGNLFLISKSDYDLIKKGEEFRLKDLFNVC